MSREARANDGGVPGRTLRCAVRELREHDLMAYKVLRDESLSQHADAFTSDAATDALRAAESYRSRLGSSSTSDTFTLGAFVDDQLVGALTCERDNRLKVRHLGHLIGMMVATSQQGRGIGRVLLDAAIHRARQDAGLHQLTLSVTATNTAAVQLYERAGFVRYGRLEGAICVNGRLLTKDLMRLALR